MRPQDAYSLAKTAAELLVDGAVARGALRAVSLRSSWLQFEQNIEANIGELVRNKDAKSNNYHSYTDPYDLAEAIRLALEADLDGHEVIFTAAPDNVGGRDFAELVRETYRLDIPIRHLARRDASGISSAKAQRVLGWEPKRSWRDYLDTDGRLLPGLNK
jgi:nucleoside-diphosphate-sugar epimerase